MIIPKVRLCPCNEFSCKLQAFPTLHLWIRSLDSKEQFAYHYRAQEAFPNSTPIMGIGKNKMGAKPTVDLEEKQFRERVKDAVGMLIGTGSKGGTGGSTGMSQ